MLNKKTFVRPSGIAASAELIIVGEQPGREEVMLGQPFAGAAGKELDKCLETAGLLRAKCYVTNTFKDLDLPLGHYLTPVKKGQKITSYQLSGEGQEYAEFLQSELGKCKSRIILATGNVPLFVLTSRVGISKWRGSVLESTLVPGKLVIPCYHPSSVLYGQYMNRRLIIFDMIKARGIIKNGWTALSRNLTLQPSFSEAKEFLLRTLSAGLAGTIISFDIEVYNNELSCISFALDKQNAISIPFVWASGDYYNPDQELELMLLVARILENPKIPLLGQNLTFDCAFLFRKYGLNIPTKRGRIQDTMIAQRTMMPDYPMGLDFIDSIHTTIPYYKDEGKKWFQGGGSFMNLWQYNAMDSVSCAEAFPEQLKMLTEQDNLIAYNNQRDIIGPLVYMMEHGVKVDVEGLGKKSAELSSESEKLRAELDKLAGFELNPNSSKQLCTYFYGVRGYKPYLKRGKGTPTCDKDALKRLSRLGAAEAKIIMRIRQIEKLVSNYANLDKIDPDGRIRCSYNPCGTKFSRLSSSENIFGTGTNLQNWPHPIQFYLMADEGYVGVAIDEGQAENRIVAYEGRCPAMMAAFESGIDLHSLTASGIFSCSAEQVADEYHANPQIMAPIADGLYPKRLWGKKANHAFNYDLGYRSFAFKYEIPEAEGLRIYSGYHKTYPEVQKTFHVEVRQQIQYNRTITNLLGRKTVFMGMLGDDLYKEAYSCKPQGTVGDLINERGLNYLYYNQHEFQEVELLMQIHDEIVFQIPLRVGWLRIAQIIRAIKLNLETPLITSKGKSFVIPADVTLFKRCKAGEELKELPPSDLAYAEKLRAAWERLMSKETIPSHEEMINSIELEEEADE